MNHATRVRRAVRFQTKKRWNRDFAEAFKQGMHWEPVSGPPCSCCVCVAHYG